MTLKTPPMPSEPLLAMLHEQREVLFKLKALADRQQKLVIEDDPHPLLNLLADRQRLVDRLAQLSGRMAPYRQRWPEFVSALPDDDREQAETILAEINGMVASVLASDERDTQCLAARQMLLTEEMSNTQAGRRATQAYQKPLAGPSRLDTTDLNA
jgi:hypothetical protein